MGRLVLGDARNFFDWDYVEQFANAELTSLPGKSISYAREPCFRETLYCCALRARDVGDEIGDRLTRVGLGLIRPDAIAYRKVPLVLEYYSRLGIRPFFFRPVQMTPGIVREVWRYQLNAASGERLILLDMLFSASPSILVLFTFRERALPVPCSVAMADAKGHAFPQHRLGWELRSHLGSANKIEVHFHTADEPADVIRDGGVILGPEPFAAALAGRHDADVSEAIQAVARQIHEDGEGAGDVIFDEDDLFQDCGPLPLGELVGPGVDRWELIRRLADACEMYAGPGDDLINESGTDVWWRRIGMLDERNEYLSSRTGWATFAITADRRIV